jgi:hypothetical protein
VFANKSGIRDKAKSFTSQYAREYEAAIPFMNPAGAPSHSGQSSCARFDCAASLFILSGSLDVSSAYENCEANTHITKSGSRMFQGSQHGSYL